MVKAADTPETLIQSDDSLTDSLGTYVRFNVVANDPNAGFYSTTHEEKNRALYALDCLASDDAFAFQRRMNEIHRHQKWEYINRYRQEHGITAAGDVPQEVFEEANGLGAAALRSIGFLWGDYLHQAIDQRQQLCKLQYELSEFCMNPNVTLPEEVEMKNIQEATDAIPLLARFVFLKDIVPRNPDKYKRGDMLKTFEDRTLKSLNGKNKTIYDVFTMPKQKEFPAEREFVEEKVGSLTVRDSRQLIDEAINDQERRSEFWLVAVRSTRNHAAAWFAGRQVLDSLGLSLYD